MTVAVGETQYRRDPDVVARRIGEETVLVPVRRSVGDLESIYTLNGPAASLWDLLAAPQGVAALAAALAAEYDVDGARAAADVRAFLAEMAGLRLVEASADV